MKFSINGAEWSIKTVNKYTMTGKAVDSTALGYTIYETQEIYLLDDQANILRTLKHELIHVWLWEYGHYQKEKEFIDEDVCEIVASSNNFVNEVVEKFKKEMEE